MAEKKSTPAIDDLVTVYKTFFHDLPLASVRWRLGLGEEKEAVETAWKGYDAGVRLAATTIDNLYRNPVFGDMVARSIEGMLRWQRFSSAVSGAFFSGLWQAVGLPTVAETQTLRAELRALREELHGQTNGVIAKPKASVRLPSAKNSETAPRVPSVAMARSNPCAPWPDARSGWTAP